MPTFDTLRQEADNRGLVRKIMKAILFLGRGDVELPDTLFDLDGTLRDLKAAGYLPVGLVTPDGYTFSREINKEDVSALGYASAIRSDITTVPRSVTFTALENLKRTLLELKYGMDLSQTEQNQTTGELVFDEPDLPVGEEYRLVILGSDGPAAANWLIGKGYGTAKLAGTGDETWGQEGALGQEYTLDIFADATTGTPVRHYIGGTGALAASLELGFPKLLSSGNADTPSFINTVDGGESEDTVFANTLDGGNI